MFFSNQLTAHTVTGITGEQILAYTCLFRCIERADSKEAVIRTPSHSIGTMSWDFRDCMRVYILAPEHFGQLVIYLQHMS